MRFSNSEKAEKFEDKQSIFSTPNFVVAILFKSTKSNDCKTRFED